MSSIDKFLTQHTAQPDLNKAAKYSPLPSSELALTSQVDFIDEEGWFGPGYNTYVKRFNPTGDPEQDQRILDDLRYQNQGYLMRTLNTVPRLVGSLVGYVGESIGVAGGFAADVLVNAADLAKDVKTGREIELKGLNYTFDNFMISLGADFAEGSKALFPNYASANYQDQGFLDRIISTEFILNEFVDGLAFLGSAAVGGTGVLKGIGAVGKLTKGLKVGQAVQKEMALIRAAERAGKKLTAFQKVLKNTPNAMVTAVNTIAESGIEANGVKKELMRSYENGEWGSNLTPKEAEIIATEKASEAFKFNVMLLGLTNHLETDMLFGKSTLTKRNVQNALAGKRIVESYIKSKAALNAINESFQEGIQTSIERYETNLVTGRDEVVPRSRYHKQGWLGSTANVLEEFLDGIGNNEQQASMFIGSLIGAGGSYVSSKYREKSLNADFKRLMQNTQIIGDIYNRDYESLFEEEEYEEPVIDPNTKQQVMNGTTPVTQKKKRFKRDANGELVYDQEVIERKLEHLRRDRNLFKEAELARLKGEDEIGDLIRNTHLARLANTWFGLDYGDLILKTKLEKIAAEEAAAAGSSKADNIMLELSKNLDLVDKLKVAYDNIQMEVLNHAKTREEEENFTKDKSAALLYEEAKRMFLRDLSTNNALGTSQTTPIPAAKNNLYNRILSFFNVSTTPATATTTTTPATTTAPVVTLQDSVDMAIKDSEEFSKRLLENDDTVYEEWNNLRLERKKIKDPKTSAQAKFNIQKDWQSYRDLMLEEGYFNGNNDSLLQRIRRHTAATLKRNGRLETALEAKIKNAPTTFELYETAKQLGTFRDLSQKNIQLAEDIKAMAERGKNTEKTKIQGDMAAAQLKKTAQEKIIQDLDRAINSNPSDRQEKQIIDVDQKLQDYVDDTINLYTAAAIANIFVYENKDAANNFLEQGVLTQLITGETLVKVLINGELFEERSIPVDIDTLIDVGVINTIFSYHKDQAQDEIDRLDNAIQDLQQEELRVDRELDVLDNLDFTQTSESFRMANLPEDELPAAVKDYLIKQDIERGEEILKTETTNFQNGIYSTTNLKKIIDYLKLLLNYPSLGANEPAVQQLLADLNILFNQMDTAFKKQIAEGKKFTDEHEGSITEYIKDFSTDPNKPVFIEIIDEIKRLHTVKNDPASDPKDIAAAELKLDMKRNELQNLLSNLNIPEILWELKEFLLTNGAEIDEALIEILTRKSTSKNTQPQAEVIRQNRTLVEYSTSYRLFQGVIKGIPYLNTYLISDRIDSSEFAAVINNMKDTDIDFKTPPSAADFATFKANLLRLFEDYKKARRIEKSLRFLNSGVDLTAFYQNAPMPAVFPSPQQQVVMEEAVAFLETKETSKIFVIDGAAGTGKTFLLKLFLGARKVFTWSPYTHADANLQATLNIEPSTVTIQSLLNLLNPKNIPANDITAKFNFVVAEINKIKAGTDTNLIAMVEKLEKGTPLIIDEIYAADVDVQIILAVLAETFKAKVIVLGDPNQISNAHGLANYAWQKIAVAAQHGTPLSVRFRSFVLPIAAVQEAFYGKTSKIDELNTVYNDGLGVNGLEDMVKFVKDIKEKLANGVNPNDCKVIVSDDLVKVYSNLLTSQGITVEVLSVEKAQGREFPYVWVDITKMNVNGIVAETAHNKLVYTAVSRGKLYIGYNNADDRPADQRTKIRSSFDASLTEDIGFKQMLFNANERTYLELLQRRNAPSTRPMPAPIVAPTTTTNTPPPVVPLPVAPVAPASPQRTAIVNSALNKGKIVLNFLKKLKTVIANKINNPPATNNTTTNPPPNNQTPPVPPTTNTPIPPNNQTTPVPPTTNIPVTNTPIPPTTNTPVPPTTSNQSEIEAKKADIERRRQEELYESLGFNKNVDLSLNLLTTTERILNGTNKKLYYSSNDIITGEETLKEIKGDFNIKRDAGSRVDLYKGDTKIANFKIVTDENDFIIDDISTVRNIRRQGVMTFLIRALSRSNEMKHGKTLKIRTNILKQDGKSLLDSLEKKGIGFYTTDDLFQISPTNLLINKTPIKAGVEELFESNESLANAVYEAAKIGTEVNTDDLQSSLNTLLNGKLKDQVIFTDNIEQIYQSLDNYDEIYESISLANDLGIDDLFVLEYFKSNKLKVASNKIKTKEQLYSQIQQDIQDNFNIEKLLVAPISREKQLKEYEKAKERDLKENGIVSRETEIMQNEEYWKRTVDEVNRQRKENLEQWLEYITKDNPEYSKNSAFQYLVWKSITKEYKVDKSTLKSQPPVLNRRVLADLYQKFIDKHIAPTTTNFKDNYDNLLIEYNKQNSEITEVKGKSGLKGEWITIKGKDNDPDNFTANVEKLRSLAYTSWCVKSSMAESYLNNGDFYIYIEKDNNVTDEFLMSGKDISEAGIQNVKVGIGTRYGGEVEIQGQSNDGTVPLDYYEQIKEFVDKKGLNSVDDRLEEAKSKFEQVQEYKNYIKEKQKITNNLEFKNTLQYLRDSGSNFKILKNGKIVINNLKVSNILKATFNNVVELNRIEWIDDFTGINVDDLGNQEILDLFKNKKRFHYSPTENLYFPDLEVSQDFRIKVDVPRPVNATVVYREGNTVHGINNDNYLSLLNGDISILSIYEQIEFDTEEEAIQREIEDKKKLDTLKEKYLPKKNNYDKLKIVKGSLDTNISLPNLVVAKRVTNIGKAPKLQIITENSYVNNPDSVKYVLGGQDNHTGMINNARIGTLIRGYRTNNYISYGNNTLLDEFGGIENVKSLLYKIENGQLQGAYFNRLKAKLERAIEKSISDYSKIYDLIQDIAPEVITQNWRFKGLIDYTSENGYPKLSKIYKQGIQGFYNNKDGKVYISNNLSEQDREKVLLHEVIGHKGIEELLSDLEYKEYKNILFGVKDYLYNNAEELLKRTAHKSISDLAKDYQYDEKTEKGQLSIIKELLARQAETNPSATWFERLLGRLQLFLAKIFGQKVSKEGVVELLLLSRDKLNDPNLNINNVLSNTNQQKQQAIFMFSEFLDLYLQDFEQVERILKEEKIIDKDCTGKGKLKAEKGLQTNFTKGGKWRVIKDLKGYPTHKEGGVDLTISKDGVSIKNGNTQFIAKHGLVIPKN